MLHLRVDDFPAAQPTEWWDPGKHTLLARLEAQQIPYYLGIIPFLIDEEHVDFLRTLQYATIAQHGADHGFGKWRPRGEFDDMAADQVLEQIQRGRDRLIRLLNLSSPIECFIPPFNIFDQNVLDALNHCGFSLVTGGPESYRDMDITTLDFGALRFVPSIPPYYTSNGDLGSILHHLLPDCPDDRQVVLHLTGCYT